MWLDFLTQLFQGEEQDHAVWDELFLIKVNVGAFEDLFSKLSSNELIQLKVCFTKIQVLMVLGQ